MKKTILLSYLALLISFAAAFASEAESAGISAEAPAPVIVAVSPERPAPTMETPPMAKATPAATDRPLPAVSPQRAPEPAPETICVERDGETFTEDLEEYVLHVVAAEMPAAFELEALKAQAVAARSYALYCAESGRHDDGQVCTDFACCQAWSSREELEAAWGDSYEKNLARIREAVDATRGQYLIYEGEPVFAAFHSSSCGMTEDCAALWNARPYLVSVSSPENADSVPDYVSHVELSPLDFRDTVLHARPQADLTGEESQWLGGMELDESGRVRSAVLGGQELSGAELRGLFSLRSTAFTLEYTGESFLFTVTGFGHGVGMSQYGAKVMAASGESYASILAHYYPDTVLVS